MDSRNAFERQLTDEIEYEVGPPQGVDALAVTRQAKSTTPGWRFSMSSTLKFAAASVALAVAGTAIILAEPGGSGDGVAQPGAESVTSGATPLASSANGVAAQETGASYFTGSLDFSSATQVEATFTEGPPDTARGGAVLGGVSETSDERISGTVSRAWSADFPVTAEPGFMMATGSLWRIENDGGAWTGYGTEFTYNADITAYEVNDPATWGVGEEFVLLTGEGGYQGLSAMMHTVADEVDGRAVSGLVFPGESPPVPEVMPGS